MSKNIMEVIPAIIPKDFEDLKDKMSQVLNLTSLVQIDITDGKFVSSKSWPYVAGGFDENFYKILREDEGFPFWDKLDFEIDLMVEKPEDEINYWISAGAKRIIVHIESTKEMQMIVGNFKKRFGEHSNLLSDVELGVALNIDTPFSVVSPFLDDIDFVQFMGISKIGFQGVHFDERVIEKIDEVRQNNPGIIISVDGGVNLENAERLLEVGVNRLVVGSAIFESADIRATIEEFEKLK